jgi:hypothetical protein
MTRPRTPKPTYGLDLLLVLGITLVTVGIVLHWVAPERYENVDLLPIIVGFVIALMAAYFKDPDRTRGGATLVADVGGRVVHSAVEFRTGERGTDPVVRIEKTSDPAAPEQPQSVTVSVTSEGGAPGTPVATPAPLANPVAWNHGRDEGVL